MCTGFGAICCFRHPLGALGFSPGKLGACCHGLKDQKVMSVVFMRVEPEITCWQRMPKMMDNMNPGQNGNSLGEKEQGGDSSFPESSPSPDQKQGESLSIIAGSQPGGSSRSRDCGGTLLVGLLSMACPACFFKQPRTTCPGVAPPTVCWAPPHQSLIYINLYVQTCI